MCMVKAMQPARMVELWLNFVCVSKCERNGAKPSRCLERPKVDFLQHCSKAGGEMETFERKSVCKGMTAAEREWNRKVYKNTVRWHQTSGRVRPANRIFLTE